jgi:hypothetical protein
MCALGVQLPDQVDQAFGPSDGCSAILLSEDGQLVSWQRVFPKPAFEPAEPPRRHVDDACQGRTVTRVMR